MDTIIALMAQYPAFSAVLTVIGILRVINKPLFTFLRTLTAATPSMKDDEVLTEVENSKAYTYLTFLLDYFASVKLPAKK